jgi:predicted anti-sigma-YlaC factor YlaD
MTCEEIDVLISGYIDGELTQQERQRVDIHLRECLKCRDSLQKLETVRQRIHGLEMPQPSRKEWEDMENYVLLRLFRKVGWIIVIVWLSGTAVYGLYEYASAPTEPFLGKLAVFGLLFGVVMLFVSVVLERTRELRTDRYRGVQK